MQARVQMRVGWGSGAECFHSATCFSSARGKSPSVHATPTSAHVVVAVVYVRRCLPAGAPQPMAQMFPSGPPPQAAHSQSQGPPPQAATGYPAAYPYGPPSGE